MEDLITWLRACLDDDEKTAKAAISGNWQAQRSEYGPNGEWEILAWQTNGTAKRVVYTGYEGGIVSKENALHIERHEPRRVLEDIRMKRDLLDEYEAVAHLDTDNPEPEYAHGRAGGLGEAVKMIAAAYRHRPGWKQEWEA